MKTDSFKQGEKAINEINSDEGECDEPMPDGRNVLSTIGLRRGIRNVVGVDGGSLRKSVLAYNRGVLLYFSPIFYLIYYIAQNI